MIFEENCFSRYILLTDQISLPDCLYFLRYWKYEYLNYLFISLWRHKFWITEAAARGFLWKRRSWKFHKIHRKTPVSKKEALAHHTFSCEFCEISKNTYFTKHLWTTASWISLSFLTRLFCYMTKKSRQNFKYLKNEKSF